MFPINLCSLGPRIHIPYEFIGFGVMDGSFPYEFIGFGVMDCNCPYEFIGFGVMDYCRLSYEFIGFGVMDGHCSCEFMGFETTDGQFPYKFIGWVMDRMDDTCPYELILFGAMDSNHLPYDCIGAEAMDHIVLCEFIGLGPWMAVFPINS